MASSNLLLALQRLNQLRRRQTGASSAASSLMTKTARLNSPHLPCIRKLKLLCKNWKRISRMPGHDGRLQRSRIQRNKVSKVQLDQPDLSKPLRRNRLNSSRNRIFRCRLRMPQFSQASFYLRLRLPKSMAATRCPHRQEKTSPRAFLPAYHRNPTSLAIFFLHFSLKSQVHFLRAVTLPFNINYLFHPFHLHHPLRQVHLREKLCLTLSLSSDLG